MKNLFIALLLLVFGCQESNQSSYLWIQSINDYMLEGAQNSVEAKGNRHNDLAVLETMKIINQKFKSMIDSIEHIGKNETMTKVKILTDSIPILPARAQSFFNLSTNLSDRDFAIQLALLQQEILRMYANEVAIKDISFDRMELKFFPEATIQDNIYGKLLFTASSADFDYEGIGMFINGERILIEDREGIVSIPISELRDGTFEAKIEINHIDYFLEQTIRVPKQWNQTN